MTAIQKHEAQIAAAQARFMQAVSQAITKLINECGYSRERATAALLRELGRGDGGLLEQDEEVSETLFFWHAKMKVLSFNPRFESLWMLHTLCISHD
jgi:hypothetical protein